MQSNNLFSLKKEHESAKKHVSGRAKYTDDILEPKNLLHGAIGYSTIAKGRIKKIDLSDVINSNGVEKVITYRDIPGVNDVGPVFKGDPIFTSSPSLIISLGFTPLKSVGSMATVSKLFISTISLSGVPDISKS